MISNSTSRTVDRLGLHDLRVVFRSIIFLYFSTKVLFFDFPFSQSYLLFLFHGVHNITSIFGGSFDTVNRVHACLKTP